MPRKLKILLSGMIAGDPGQGGATWAVLQYLLGLRRLGHAVTLVEPVKAIPPEVVGYFRQVADHFRLDAGLLRAGTRETVGLAYDRMIDFARKSDVLLNISGMLTDPDMTAGIPIRVYLDLDPAFNQLWHMQGIDMRFAGHTHFVTIGQAIGRPDCPVPTCGLSWITTPQPIALDYWPMISVTPAPPAITTIGNWRGYGSVEFGGMFYGQKAHSLRPLIDLPTRTRERFELALAIHPDETKDLAALAANGWVLLDPAEVAGTPDNYQRFIRSSKAEFGIVKSGYAASRCAWFSDRSLCYLASGRPVIAQETGFSSFLPTGEGLFAFTSAADVLAAIDAINADYPRHARAARAIAEEHFDSDVVLARLLERIGAAS